MADSRRLQVKSSTSSNTIWSQQYADEVPLLAAAIHDGHAVRDEVAKYLALEDAERLREEDPFTREWAEVASSRVIGLRSRFEVDLNRPREKAVYRVPEDAWGLRVWREEPPRALFERSLEGYDAFYQAMEHLLERTRKRFGRFVLYDLHSYNHRRPGPDRPPADEQGNPQVNVGTGTMDRAFWAPVVDRFIAELRAHDFPGGRLDVRENVKFQGGHFPAWVHRTFPRSGCALAIEIKKFFMDEWTGEPDRDLIQAIRDALRSTVPGVLQELADL
jgi:N-formylglutamate amidohydrolase